MRNYRLNVWFFRGTSWRGVLPLRLSTEEREEVHVWQPDFSEKRDDCPFLGSESKYVIDLVNAVNNMLK